MNPATGRAYRAPRRPPLPDAAIALATIDFVPNTLGARPAILFPDDGLRRRWERIVEGDRS